MATREEILGPISPTQDKLFEELVDSMQKIADDNPANCPGCKALARTTFFGKPPLCSKHRPSRSYLGLGK